MNSLPTTQTTLESKRLILRPLCDADTASLSKIANDWDVAKFLSSMPHPFTLEIAKSFIESSNNAYLDNENIVFAITKKDSKKLIGIIELDLNSKDNHATASYWIGKDYWGKGYTTEALEEVVRFGFEELKLHRIASHHFHNNPASGRVMQKVGLKLEGKRIEHFRKDGEYLDILDYGIILREWRENLGNL